MTYKPRLHHFARLLVSVAVGLSFTGCGNSSNGGSTGSSFEQVPLLGGSFDTVEIVGTYDGLEGNDYFQLNLVKDLSCQVYFGDVNKKSEYFNGNWTVKQSPNNTYQIQILNLKSGVPSRNDCTMTCSDLDLTIPENQLKYYSAGTMISGATLEGKFHHEPNSCSLNESTRDFKITKQLTSLIQY